MNFRLLSSVNSFGQVILFGLLILVFSCNEDESPYSLVKGTVTDHQGRTYSTVKIGDQWWMSENLAVTTFTNGDPIPYVDGFDSAGWSGQQIPAYSIYQDQADAPGLLYNAYVLNDSRIIAPSGWHIATDDDWKRLEEFIGMSIAESVKTGWRGEKIGDALKEKGLDNWARYDGVWASDSYGFSANAGGCRLFDSRFSYPYGLSFSGFWWTSTTHPGGEHFYRHLDYKTSAVFRSHTYDSYGMSIRCVKD